MAGTGHDVTLVTKTELVESNTYHAQGGIAAAIFSDDDPKLHAADTMAAGHGLCDPKAVDILTREVLTVFVSLPRPVCTSTEMHRGICYVALRRRILVPAWVHAGGDATGKVLELDVSAWCVRIRVSISSNMPSSKTLSCVTAVLPASGC